MVHNKNYYWMKNIFLKLCENMGCNIYLQLSLKKMFRLRTLKSVVQVLKTIHIIDDIKNTWIYF